MISTNCRGCNTYLKIEKGQAIPPTRYDDQPRYQSGPSDPSPEPSPSSTPAPPSTPPREEVQESLPQPKAAKKRPGSDLPAPKPEAEAEVEAKTVAEGPQQRDNLSPLPKSSSKTSSRKKNRQAQTPPVAPENSRQEAPAPKKSPSKEASSKKTGTKKATSAPVPDAAIPRSEPRNPLPQKPNKPKAPAPPAKPKPTDPVVAQATPAAEPKPSQPEPSVERYRPQVSPASEPTKPKIAPLINREKKREVKCFECAQFHEILADSKSALCPHCGAYIGLGDYDIKDQYNSRIQTRGNVFVHKKGYITGITIHAHNLTIEGEIQGGAECTGDFIVRKNGKINGEVVSDRVIIERRAKVDFLSPVEAREVIIDGHVTGAVACKKLVLKKRATLDGDLTVASLSVEEGAKHTGKIKMTGLL